MARAMYEHIRRALERPSPYAVDGNNRFDLPRKAISVSFASMGDILDLIPYAQRVFCAGVAAEMALPVLSGADFMRRWDHNLPDERMRLDATLIDLDYIVTEFWNDSGGPESEMVHAQLRVKHDLEMYRLIATNTLPLHLESAYRALYAMHLLKHDQGQGDLRFVVSEAARSQELEAESNEYDTPAMRAFYGRWWQECQRRLAFADAMKVTLE